MRKVYPVARYRWFGIVPTLSRIRDRFAIGTLTFLFLVAIISVSAAAKAQDKVRLTEGSTEKVADFTIEIGYTVEVGLNRPQDVETLKKYRQNKIANKAIENGFVGPMILIRYITDKKTNLKEELVMKEETHRSAQPLRPAPPSLSDKFEDVYAVDAHCPVGYRLTIWQLITANGTPISLLEIFVAPRSGVIEVYRLPITKTNLSEFRTLHEHSAALASVK